MSIYLFCEKCFSTCKRGERKCPKCSESFSHSKRYRVVVRYENRKVSSLFDNLSLAQEGERRLEDELKAKIAAEKQPKIPTLNDLWEQYLPFAKLNKKTWLDDFYCYRKHLQPRFGNKRMEDILPLDIERFKKELKEGKNKDNRPFQPATIKRQLVLLRRLFNLGIQWNLFTGKNPVSSVAMPHVDNFVTEFFTDDELSRLMTVLNNWPFDDSASFIKFSLFTGFRRGELFKLKWEHIDFERRMILLPDPKGKRAYTIPVCKEALDVLQKLQRTSEFCFPGRNGQQRRDFKGPWKRVRKAAELPENYRFHGIRHHFASTLVSNGVELAVVGKLLGHKQAQTTMRYAHLQPGILQDAAQKAGQLLSPKQPAKVRKLIR